MSDKDKRRPGAEEDPAEETAAQDETSEEEDVADEEQGPKATEDAATEDAETEGSEDQAAGSGDDGHGDDGDDGSQTPRARDPQGHEPESAHRKIERKMPLFSILVFVTILIGGMAEIIPLFSTAAVMDENAYVEPYSPLELAGRDIYVREGCYNCHSQMVRPLRSETLRWKEWSRSYEYRYDRPFQMGSRRIGPDLHRIAGRYNDAWHFQHMRNPSLTSPGTIMPAYPWLYEDRFDVDDVRASVDAMSALGVPYDDVYAEMQALIDDEELDIDDEHAAFSHILETEATHIVDNLQRSRVADAEWDMEIMAVIAYLQSVGRYRPMFEDLAVPSTTLVTEVASDSESVVVSNAAGIREGDVYWLGAEDSESREMVRIAGVQESTVTLAYPLRNDHAGNEILHGSERAMLGRAIFEEMRCRRCHGPGGIGGVVNPNYISGEIPNLRELADRLGIWEPEDLEGVIARLEAGEDLTALEEAPFRNWNRMVGQLEDVRNVIRYGREAGVLDPEGEDPIDMPTWRYRLHDQRIEAVVTYLLGIFPWEEF